MRFYFSLAMNLLTLMVLFAAGEVVVRRFSVPTPLGLSFARTLLLPKSWEHVRARNAGLLQDAPANISYFVSDSLLGWTVGPSRRSADRLYSSSAEGIRCARPGMVYADDTASYRIATVGDSFTFCLESPFEDSWEYQLERALDDTCVVLNFGVDGYGVDQAYLRYCRDVRPWRPAVAILGFIQHDLYRSLSVYSFITFPEWGFPFSKPRFHLRSGALELLNVPLISPDLIVAKASVTQLPFLEFDSGYDPLAWEWHSYYSSRLVRWLLSRFPRYPLPRPEAGRDTLPRINSELLLDFTRLAAADGTIPLLVYFPSRSDFEGQEFSAKDAVLAALQRSGVHCLDLTACIREVGPERAFIAGRPHYAAAGNAAVAACLLPVVRDQIR
jgi:hypothetical protein